MNIKYSINNESNPKRSQRDIKAIIVHHTGSSASDSNMRKYLNKDDYISAHYMVAKNGEVFQLMDNDVIAYHCGVSSWKGLKTKGNSLNWCTLGIEVNSNGKDFTNMQYIATQELIRFLMDMYDIPADMVLRHADIAPKRKTDIGENFYSPNTWAEFQQDLKLPPYTDLAKKQMYAIMNANSVLWNMVEKEEMQQKLADMNSFFRHELKEF